MCCRSLDAGRSDEKMLPRARRVPWLRSKTTSWIADDVSDTLTAGSIRCVFGVPLRDDSAARSGRGLPEGLITETPVPVLPGGGCHTKKMVAAARARNATVAVPALLMIGSPFRIRDADMESLARLSTE